jgi:putative transposase
MIDSKSDMPVTRQCLLLDIKRGKVYHKPKVSKRKLELLNRIDELYTEDPTRGQRRMRHALRKQFGLSVGRSVIRKLMEMLGLEAIHPRKNLSSPNLQHKKYPYLLRNVPITRVNQVWSTDITYIRLKGGFVYLTAIVDWYSRFVLSWRLSTTLDTRFCAEALQEAFEKYGDPEVFNTDQGCQFTSAEFTGILESRGIAISMDGKGRALDNIFVERLWRTVKYDDVYLKGYTTVPECQAGLCKFFERYNHRREHQSLEGNYPAEVYFGKIALSKVA